MNRKQVNRSAPPSIDTYLATSRKCLKKPVAADLVNPRNDRYFSSHSDQTVILTDSACRNSDCVNMKEDLEQLKDRVSQLEKDKACLLLRAFTGDMERTACWSTLRKHDIDEEEWGTFSTFTSLDVDTYYKEYALEARILLLDWYDPEGLKNLNLEDGKLSQQQRTKKVRIALSDFFMQRGDGNAVAHPFLRNPDDQQLLKLAKVARGEKHSTAWLVFAGWSRMQVNIRDQEGDDGVKKYVNPRGDFDEIEDISKLRLDNVILEDNELQRFLELRDRHEKIPHHMPSI